MEVDSGAPSEDEQWTHVGHVTSLRRGERTLIDVGGRTIGVFNVDETFHAIANVCPHQGGPVAEGQVTMTVRADESSDWQPFTCLEDRVIRCPWHRMEFDVVTGECIATPGFRLKSMPTMTKDGQIYVRVT